MAAPRLVPYLHYRPHVGSGAEFGHDATLIGRATLGENVALGDLAVLRADGERIDIGAGSRLLERATLHISDSRLPARIGLRATVGRYALVHACTLADDCVLGDGAVVMDGSVVGPRAVIAAGALVPPGKTLDGGVLYAGNPARPVRDLAPDDFESFRDAVRARRQENEYLSFTLPPLSMTPYAGAGAGPFHTFAGGSPTAAESAFVAANAAVRGRVEIGEDASVWFATAICADGARVSVGARSNVQDNSILATRADTGPIVIGSDVTVGHNVRMGSCTVGDGCLIGMGAEVGDGVTVKDGAVVGARAFVEPGTTVEADHIWAGRPARAFRPVNDKERAFFAMGCAVYVDYTARYRARAA